MTSDLDLPAHIETTVRTIAELHARHKKHTSLVQQVASAVIGFVASPAALALLTVAVVAWVGANLGMAATGRTPWDTPPFSALSTAVSLLALYTTLLILTTQRHEDRLATHREQLTLELAILSEQKSAKIIELLEKIRHDSPHLMNHVDEEARAMAQPSDTLAVLTALHEAESIPHEEASALQHG